MATHGKGTVTPLSSLFPAEEARKAAQLMQQSITQKHKELENLHSFVDDNTNLINLVQRLPDQLNHNIMVPFGKGAFFPGRLVHTNEFMVLLGDGYFVERSSKQTVDILRRRGKTLDSHVDSLRADIEDLKTEASFFDRTAAEATEGLIDIREEYTDDEEDSNKCQEKSDGPGVPEAVTGTGVIDDEEYARIMSRFDELEKEELDAENAEEQDDGENEEDFNILEDGGRHGEDFNNVDQRHADCKSYGKELSRISVPVTVGESQSNDGNSSLLSVAVDRDLPSHDKVLPGRSTVKDYVQPLPKTSIKPVLEPKPEEYVSMPKPDAGSQIPKSAASSLKAFPGSIIERTDNLQPLPDKVTGSQPSSSSSQSSKPVSRFKMQRRGG